MIVLACWMIVTVSSQYPGTSPKLASVAEYFPLSYGYSNMFHITYRQAMILNMLPCLFTAWAMIYIISKQIEAMASSRLLPEILNHRVGESEIPVLRYAFICTIGFLTSLYVSALKTYGSSSQTAFMAGCFVYLSMFYCYVIFKWRYSHMERTFRNPLSYLSVPIGVFVYVLGLYFVLVDDISPNRAVTLFYFSYMLFMTFYYFLYVETHQKFSESEAKVFFKAYIIKSTFYHHFFLFFLILWLIFCL
jgi:amino acid transporter